MSLHGCPANSAILTGGSQADRTSKPTKNFAVESRCLKTAAGGAHRCGDDVGTTQEGRRAGTVTDIRQYDEGEGRGRNRSYRLIALAPTCLQLRNADGRTPQRLRRRPPIRPPGEDATRIKWKAKRTSGCHMRASKPDAGRRRSRRRHGHSPHAPKRESDTGGPASPRHCARAQLCRLAGRGRGRALISIASVRTSSAWTVWTTAFLFPACRRPLHKTVSRYLISRCAPFLAERRRSRRRKAQAK